MAALLGRAAAQTGNFTNRGGAVMNADAVCFAVLALNSGTKIGQFDLVLVFFKQLAEVGNVAKGIILPVVLDHIFDQLEHERAVHLKLCPRQPVKTDELGYPKKNIRHLSDFLGANMARAGAGFFSLNLKKYVRTTSDAGKYRKFKLGLKFGYWPCPAYPEG